MTRENQQQNSLSEIKGRMRCPSIPAMGESKCEDQLPVMLNVIRKGRSQYLGQGDFLSLHDVGQQED